MSPVDRQGGEAEPTKEVALTRRQLRQIAMLAIRDSAWDVLDAVEPALREFGDDPPLDVYVDRERLRREAHV